jgi:hypothetical protein
MKAMIECFCQSVLIDREAVAEPTVIGELMRVGRSGKSSEESGVLPPRTPKPRLQVRLKIHLGFLSPLLIFM